MVIVYYSFCFPRTKTVENGVNIRGPLWGRFNFYSWKSFLTFEIFHKTTWVIDGKILQLYLRDEEMIIRLHLGEKSAYEVERILNKKIESARPIELQVGDSLEQKMTQQFWVFFLILSPIHLISAIFLGSGFITVGILLIIISGGIFIWIYIILCQPRTQIEPDGLFVRSLLLRRRKFYSWKEFSKFIFNQDHNSLYLYARNGIRIKLVIGWRNPEVIKSYLINIVHLEEIILKGNDCDNHRGKKAEYICPDCGKTLCVDCIVIKRAGRRGRTSTPPMIKGILCYYRFLMKGTIVSLVLAILLSIPLLIIPFYTPIIFINSLNYRMFLGPVLGLGLGNILANYFCLLQIKRLKIFFEVELKIRWNILLVFIFLGIFIAVNFRFGALVFGFINGDFAIHLLLFLAAFNISFPILTPTFRFR